MRNIKKLIHAAAAVLVALIICAVAYFNGESDNKGAADVSGFHDGLIVHFIDVGQGDSEFIELPGGQCMLIDAGTQDYTQTVIDKITEYGYSSIDYVVATHPHADHIGGMSGVIENFDVENFYMPQVTATTDCFEDLLDALTEKDLKINKPEAGEEIYSDSLAVIEFLAPVGDNYNNLNDYSAVVKITYGENSFLFTGDAEKVSEDEMLEREFDSLSADVLKVGHHGSDTATSADFLNAVDPEYAVISCGTGNSYGHPHTETLENLDTVGAQVYRTDELGTVTVSCDGNDGFDIQYEND